MDLPPPGSPLPFAGGFAGRSCELPKPASSLARGLQSPPQRSLLAWLETGFENGRFCETRSELLEQVGLTLGSLDAEPALLKLTSIDGEPLEVIATQSAPIAVQDRDDPGTVFVDARGPGCAVLLASRGSGVLVADAAAGWTQVFLPIPERPASPIESPVLEWCRAQDSAPLEQCIASILRQPDPIAHAVAVGAFKRLAALPVEPIDLLQSVLRGEMNGPLAMPHRWFRALDPAQRSEVERIACERASSLHTALRQHAPTHADAIAREDLEGLRALLVESGAGARLCALIAPVDRLGLRHPRTRLTPTDDRLRRAAMVDRDAWWLRLREEAT
ncbi:MAG TPA: hypothetical protein PLI95_14785 [Polyangiaceae bacterium]|nr:hypothetical protein [Polyangiaceae bacterium]